MRNPLAGAQKEIEMQAGNGTMPITGGTNCRPPDSDGSFPNEFDKF